MTKRTCAAILYISFALLSGCSLNDLPFVYHIDVQQGNVLSQQKIAQLKQGMTEAQVRFLLGTPSVTDPFHPDRWDYVYTDEPGGKRRITKRLTLFFNDGKLKSAAGGELPSDSPLRASQANG